MNFFTQGCDKIKHELRVPTRRCAGHSSGLSFPQSDNSSLNLARASETGAGHFSAEG